ncbi:hypothetical protein [Mucilaginibacter sp. CSA2-8R]|uniref:hypothetical protein n=1 Tax=Mucilaginibacter sp. CSA2-8R TaxID=3141542 RepID=UPI00315CA77F
MIFLKRLPVFLTTMLAVMHLLTACRQSPPAQKTAASKSVKPVKKVSFKKVHGIAFTEVRREYNNRLGFNNAGYHLEPEWQVTFLSDDTVRIFSIVLQKFIKQEVILDHGSVVNVAHSWLKVKHLSKDSIIFQVLYVRSMHIDEDNSNIYMKLYSNDYIKNVLHTTPARLQIPPRRDTLLVQKMVSESLKDINKAFAATDPVVMQSLSKNVTVKKKQLDRPNPLTNEFVSDNYLSPEYTITIHKAYADFSDKMQLIVDEKGKLHFAKPLTVIYDDEENRIKVMKGIVSGYLSYYVKTYPGKTLGMPHPSRIMVNVEGIKD